MKSIYMHIEKYLFYYFAKVWNIKIMKTQSKMTPGGRLNKKDGLTRYGNSHVKDKTS